MPRLVSIVGVICALVLTACGGPPSQVRTNDARSALTCSSEMLEFESVAARQELYREVARISLSEEGHQAQDLVLFPIFRGNDLIAAPGFSPNLDLLQAGTLSTQSLTFDGLGDRWPKDRRESLQGFSEREAAELVARALLSLWNIQSASSVKLDRAAGAPYAVAYVDGIVRVNPAFLYLAAALGVNAPEAGIR